METFPFAVTYSSQVSYMYFLFSNVNISVFVKPLTKIVKAFFHKSFHLHSYPAFYCSSVLICMRGCLHDCVHVCMFTCMLNTFTNVCGIKNISSISVIYSYSYFKKNLLYYPTSYIGACKEANKLDKAPEGSANLNGCQGKSQASPTVA